jgi:hypothetical protein
VRRDDAFHLVVRKAKAAYGGVDVFRALGVVVRMASPPRRFT